MRCEKDNGDVYRSYARVFKHTSVPVTFADIEEYGEYINRMRTIINVQGRYLQTLDLRATIASGSAAIEQLYGRKYKAILSSYKEALHGVNQLPAFTTNAESVLFIQGLEEFIEAQQAYIDQYAIHEEIAARGDSIIKGASGRLGDVANVYRSIESSLSPLPSFQTVQGAAQYEAQLDEVKEMQRCYLRVIDLRKIIALQDDTLSQSKRIDRTLANGYRLLSRQVELRPSFISTEQGYRFIEQLQDHIEMQRMCLGVMRKLDVINQNAKSITGKEQPYRNMAKAYTKMERSYQAMSEIATVDDLQRYSRQCDYLIEVQEAFIRLMHSEYALENDNRMKKESDVDKIKVMLGLQ